MFLFTNYSHQTGDLDTRDEAIRGGLGFGHVNIVFWVSIFRVVPGNALFYLLLVDFFEQIQQQILESILISATYEGRAPTTEEINAGLGLDDTETRTYISSTRRLIGRGIGMGLCLLGARFVGVPASMFFLVSVSLSILFYCALIADYAVDQRVEANELRYYCTYLFGISTGFYYGGFMPMLGNERVNYTRTSQSFFEFRHYLAVSTIGLVVAFGVQLLITLFAPVSIRFILSSVICAFCELLMFYYLMRAHMTSSQVIRPIHYTFLGLLGVVAFLWFTVSPPVFIRLAEILSFITAGVVFTWVFVMDRIEVNRGVTEFRPWLVLFVTIVASISFGFVRMFFYRENSLIPRILLPAPNPEAHFTNTLYSAIPFLFFLAPGLWLSFGVGQWFNIAHRFLAFLICSAIGFFVISILVSYCHQGPLTPLPYMLWLCYMEFSLGLFFAEAMNLTYMFVPTALNPGLWLGIAYEIQYILPTSLIELYCQYSLPPILGSLSENPTIGTAEYTQRYEAVESYVRFYRNFSLFILTMAIIYLPISFYFSRVILAILDRFRDNGGRDNYWQMLHHRSNREIIHL